MKIWRSKINRWASDACHGGFDPHAYAFGATRMRGSCCAKNGHRNCEWDFFHSDHAGTNSLDAQGEAAVLSTWRLAGARAKRAQHTPLATLAGAGGARGCIAQVVRSRSTRGRGHVHPLAYVACAPCLEYAGEPLKARRQPVRVSPCQSAHLV